MTARQVPATRLVWLTAGFLVWSAAFVAVYAVLSVGCAFGWHRMPLLGPVTLQRIVLVILLLVSLTAGWAVLRVAARRRMAGEQEGMPLRAFLETAAWLAAWAALASTLVSVGPVLFLTACV